MRSRCVPFALQAMTRATVLTRKSLKNWWARQDSNLRPNRYEREHIYKKAAETLTILVTTVELRSAGFQ
jgi:hypothetical protein